MSYFLKLDGIDGDAVERGHENWFTVSRISWGASVSLLGGLGGGAAAGKVTLRSLDLTTLISPSTPQLFVQCATGGHIASAQLEAVRDGDRPSVAWRWQAEDILVTDLALDGADGDPALTQTFSLTYRTLRLTTLTESAGGGAPTEVTGGWDVAANSPI